MAATFPDANRALADLAIEIQHYLRGQIRSLQIEAQGEGVILRGRASSYYGKQLAFHEVRRRSKCAVVANEIEVMDGSLTDDSV